jgi:hypothetical protein
MSPSATFLVQVHPVQMPAKNASGRSGPSANHTGSDLPSGLRTLSLKDVNGTRQRDRGSSQRRQCGLAVLRTLVTPRSTLRPSSTNAGDGMPQRARASSRTAPAPVRTIGAS